MLKQQSVLLAEWENPTVGKMAVSLFEDPVLSWTQIANTALQKQTKPPLQTKVF